MLPLYADGTTTLTREYLIAPPTEPTPLQIALGALTSALAHCRFPASTQPAQDELVLSRLLCVTSTIVSGSLDLELTDEAVCELLEVALGMAGRARLGDGLRRSAARIVVKIIHGGVKRLALMGEGERSEPVRHIKQEQQTEPEPEVHEEQTQSAESTVEATGEQSQRGEEDSSKQGPDVSSTEKTSSAVAVAAATATPFTPYALPTLIELLRVLTSLLNPLDLTHTDSMRISALGIFNSLLDLGGRTIARWPDLVERIQDQGCRYLMLLVVKSDNPVLVALALRTSSSLYTTLLPHVKLQMELFLTYIMDRLAPPPPLVSSQETPTPLYQRAHIQSPRPSPTPPVDPTTRPSTPAASVVSGTTTAVSSDLRQLMLETLGQLHLSPSFMANLWIHYDCDLDSQDVFERMIMFLGQGVLPQPSQQQHQQQQFAEQGMDNSQLLSFEMLVGFIEAMAGRSESVSRLIGLLPPLRKVADIQCTNVQDDETRPDHLPSPTTLAEQKQKKAHLITGAAAFNEKPKRGIEYFVTHDLIPGYTQDSKDNNSASIAKFLKTCSRLDKKTLGDYISKPENLDLLKAFIGLFDFSHTASIADAMRELLESFRLPGEAQPISRITEVFAAHFASFRPSEIADTDAAYVLAYSVIMLNTDQHNPQNRKRMTIEDYQRNLRGVNNGKDFPPEYLAAIHDSIRQREIIMPQEHVGQAGFDYAWKQLLDKSRRSHPAQITRIDTPAFDEEMFLVSWEPTVTAIASAFTSCSHDEFVIHKAITGFKHCAALAKQYNVPEVIDTIVLSLAHATGLLDETEMGYQSANHPVVKAGSATGASVETGEGGGIDVTVSPLSVRFGTSFKCQLATVVLFTIANGNGNAIRKGWIQVSGSIRKQVMSYPHELITPPRTDL